MRICLLNSNLNQYIIRFLFLIVVVSAPEILFGQIAPHRSYSVKDGLVNSNVYAIDQDSAGFMWFGTENGISRFDGVEFKNYNLGALGVNSFISAIHCLSKNKIIFGTGNDGIFSFDVLTGEATRINKDNVSQSNEIVISDTTIVSLHERHNLDFISAISGSSRAMNDSIHGDPQNKSFSIFKHSSGRIYVGRRDGLYELRKDEQVKISTLASPIFSINEGQNGELLLGTIDKIYSFSNTRHLVLQHAINPNNLWIRNVLVDMHNNIWYNPWGSKDIFTISVNKTINVSEVAGIRNSSITRLFQDRDGNIWAGTIGKGVYLFTNMFITVYPSSAYLPSADIRTIVRAPDGGLILGTDDGIAILDSASERIEHFKHLPFPQYVRGIEQVDENEFVVAITDVRASYSQQFVSGESKIKIRYCQGSSLITAGNELFVGSWDNCFMKHIIPGFTLAGAECDLFPGNFNKVRINSILKDDNGALWIGSQKGIVVKDVRGHMNYLETFVEDENIISISDYSPGRIVVVTNSGFIIYSNNKSIINIREVQRVIIPQTTCVFFINEAEYIAGTLNGIIYHYNNKETVLSVHQGILSESVNSIYHYPGWKNVYAGTAEGLIKIDLEKLRYSMSERLKIQYITLSHNDSIYPVDGQPLRFDYKISPYVIQTKVFTYQSPKNTKYQYRHNNSKWISIPSGDLYFSSLEPGTHIIEVRASNDNRDWGEASAVSIEILPPFYRTWWFYTITIVCFFSAVVFAFFKLLKSRRLKHDETLRINNKLVELQQKALASNLNPHFVFNSLNSIQHFINTSNQEDANIYLVKFSQLMRMQLNMADMSFVSLAEEINRLENYLSLEQMRFGERLKWSIDVDRQIDNYSLQIPNMIIQPFVENAIWHGIMPMKTQGIVNVKFKKLPSKDIEISILDNGVGYGAFPKPVNSDHQSKGIQLIHDRLVLLDQKRIDIITFKLTHPGTCVTIILSALMYKVNSIEKFNNK